MYKVSQFLNVQVLRVLPDPGAWNSCMHTFPEKSNMMDLLLPNT